MLEWFGLETEKPSVRQSYKVFLVLGSTVLPGVYGVGIQSSSFMLMGVKFPSIYKVNGVQCVGEHDQCSEFHAQQAKRL